MKTQYIGDINDYRKYALLRALQRETGVSVGIHWMLTPDDESNDGSKRAYLERRDRWRLHDPDLFDALSEFKTSGRQAQLRDVEQSAVMAGFRFFSELVPDDLQLRREVIRKGHKELADVDLVFFDPDNGLEVASKSKGKPGSAKYLYCDELAFTYRAGKSALVYQHYPRVERQQFESGLADRIRQTCPAAEVDFIGTAHVAFVLVTRPDHKHVRLAAERVASIAHLDLYQWKPRPSLRSPTNVVTNKASEPSTTAISITKNDS